MDREGDGFDRRRLLRVGVLAALAGCVSYPDGPVGERGGDHDDGDPSAETDRAPSEDDPAVEDSTDGGDGERADRRTDDGSRTDRPDRVRPPDPDAPLEPRYDTVYREATYREHEDTRLSLGASVPDAAGAAPLLVFLADSGWHGGRVVSEEITDVFARAGVAAASFEYRGREAASYPGPVRDAVAAVRWLRAKGPEWGIDPDRVTLVGGDTGAHVAALVAADGESDEFQPSGFDVDADATVDAFVGRAGIYDLRREDACEGPYGDFLGDDCDSDETQSDASPITRVDGDHPPALLYHGAADEVIDAAESRAYDEALQDAGVPVVYREFEDAGHDFMRDDERARRVDEQMVRFSFEAWAAD